MPSRHVLSNCFYPASYATPDHTILTMSPEGVYPLARYAAVLYCAFEALYTCDGRQISKVSFADCSRQGECEKTAARMTYNTETASISSASNKSISFLSVCGANSSVNSIGDVREQHARICSAVDVS